MEQPPLAVEGAPAPALQHTPFVIAPDVVLDLVLGRHGCDEAEALFEAIARDLEEPTDLRPAWIAPSTVSIVHHLAGGSRDRRNEAGPIVRDLLALVRVAPLRNADYLEAALMPLDFDSAIQFATCRRVGARLLVTREDFGKKRTPIARRTAAEALPLFRGAKHHRASEGT